MNILYLKLVCSLYESLVNLNEIKDYRYFIEQNKDFLNIILKLIDII